MIRYYESLSHSHFLILFSPKIPDNEPFCWDEKCLQNRRMTFFRENLTQKFKAQCHNDRQQYPWQMRWLSGTEPRWTNTMSLIHKIPLSTRQGTGLPILWYKYEDYKYQISCKGRPLYQRPALTVVGPVTNKS